MIAIDNSVRDKLVAFVLQRTPVWLLNEAIKDFSVQRLYGRYKRELMSEFSDLMPYTLDYAIVMAEVFKAYQCDETKCKELRFKIGKLRNEIKLCKKYIGTEYSSKVDEHNAIIEEYSKLIQPQNKLIRLYKMLNKF